MNNSSKYGGNKTIYIVKDKLPIWEKAVIYAKNRDSTISNYILELLEEDMKNPIFRCQDCQRLWKEGELKPIKDIFQRVAPGERMPAGECPECGALCHVR